MRESPSTIVASLHQAQHALTVAKDDFKRLRLRNQARTVEAAAKILNRRDIQVQASLLVQDAERAIVQANPPRQGKRTDLVTPVSDSHINSSTLRSIRRVHSKLGDSEYESIKEEFRANLEPLTRKQLLLQVQGKKKEGMLTLYFVQSEKLGLIKIGKTGNSIADRLSSMQSESPDRLKLLYSMEYPSDVDLEGELHDRFKELREHGEWFRPMPVLTDYIACLMETA